MPQKLTEYQFSDYWDSIKPCFLPFNASYYIFYDLFVSNSDPFTLTYNQNQDAYSICKKCGILTKDIELCNLQRKLNVIATRVSKIIKKHKENCEQESMRMSIIETFFSQFAGYWKLHKD